MSTNTANYEGRVSTRKLWISLAASPGAWFGVGLADMMIGWQACVHKEQYGGASHHPVARALYIIFTLVLFGVVLLAGRMSYRHWKVLSNISSVFRAEGYERKEYMALAGLFLSCTLGAGIFWLFLPLLILQQCLRAH